MNDSLRDRIKHVLDTHRCTECADDPPDWTGHLADAILATPGIAVVQLPEPDDGGGWRAIDITKGVHSPAAIRRLAAQLLAAADKDGNL